MKEHGGVPVVNAIVEVRMGSTRLPGKTMMEIVGRPSISLLLERLSWAHKVNRIIVATTTKPEDDVIEFFCRENKYVCFRGDSEDVLKRVYLAAQLYKTDIVLEVTGDCPLLDPWLIDDCISLYLKSNVDYLSNFIEQSYPPGIDVQLFSFKVLEEINRIARDEKYREHVSLYILKHPNKYTQLNLKAPKDLYFPDWHLELDELKDYELIRKIYEQLYPKNPRFTTRDIIALLKFNPDLLKINSEVKRAWEQVRKEDLL